MPVTRKYTFGREERLKNSIQIGRLIAGGNALTIYPFKVFWDFTDSDDQTIPVKAAIIVSKKSFRKAVDRNLIKRRLREAYRKNKYILIDSLTEKHIHVILIILYLPKKILNYNEIHSGCTRLLKELSLNICGNHE